MWEKMIWGIGVILGLSVGVAPTSMAQDALTRDKHAHIACAGAETDINSLLKGTRAVGFSSRLRLSSSPSKWLSIDDVAGGGILEAAKAGSYMLTPRSNGWIVRIQEYTGGENVFQTVSYFDMGLPFDADMEFIFDWATLGDMNEDGVVDIVLGADFGTIALFRPYETPGYGSFPFGYFDDAALGDVTGDGFVDVVTVSVTSNTVAVLVNDGASDFEPTMLSLSVGEGPRSVVLGDLTGDGLGDVVTGNLGNVSVLISEGEGRFAAVQHYLAGNNPRHVALGDMTGDGMLDIVTANFDGNDVSLLVGDGAGGIISQQTFPVAQSPQCIAIGDVTEDGISDIVTASVISDTVSVLVGDGTGGFAPFISCPVGYWPTSDSQVNLEIVLVDMTGDGLTDIVTSYPSSEEITVLVNDAAAPSPTPISADINKDGIVDHKDLFSLKASWHVATPTPMVTPTLTPM